MGNRTLLAGTTVGRAPAGSSNHCNAKGCLVEILRLLVGTVVTFALVALPGCGGADPSGDPSGGEGDSADSESSAVSGGGHVYYKGFVSKGEYGQYEMHVSCDRGTNCCAQMQYESRDGFDVLVNWGAHSPNERYLPHGVVYVNGIGQIPPGVACSVGAGVGKNEGYGEFVFLGSPIRKVRVVAWDARYPKQKFPSSWTKVDPGQVGPGDPPYQGP
jgi:hypothetical protein